MLQELEEDGVASWKLGAITMALMSDGLGRRGREKIKRAGFSALPL